MSAGGWSRRDTFVLVAIVVLAAVSLAWLVHPWFEASNDAAMYVSCARSLLAGDGYTFLDEPFRVRPPGFPVLILPVIVLRGVDFHALNLYVGAWGVVCVALYFAWARERVSTWVALLLAGVAWFNPGFASLRNQVMSDVPGTALVFGALLLDRWSAKKPSLARELLLGVVLGLSIYVRSIVTILVGGIVVARLLRSREDGATVTRTVLARVLPLVLVAVTLQIPWKIRDHFVHPTPPVDQTSLYDYSSGMWNVDRGDPSSARLPLSDVLARVEPHTESTLTTLGSRMQKDVPDPVSIALGAFVVLVLVVQTVRKRRAADFFALGAILLVLPYFNYQDRLLLPVMLVAWSACAELLEGLGKRVLGERGVLLPIAAASALLVVDFHPRANWDDVRHAHETCAAWAEKANAVLPRDGRVAVPMEGWRWTIWLDRPVWTLFFGWNRGGGPRGAEEVLKRHRIDYVVATPFTQSDAVMRPWLLSRFTVLRDESDLALVRVK